MMQLLSLSCLFSSLLFVYKGSCMENSRNATKPKVIYIVNNITIPENRTQGCSDNEIQTLDCLNGGVCFTVDEFDKIVLCACYKHYIGSRCQMINPNITLKQFEEKKEGRNRLIPGITASVVAVFIFVMIVIAIRRIEGK
ncbi:uncharacterized protein [Mytilus edulis]|uniref:uncharacterized protein n=1 Tax=Mytilus edulis TaxID=6550 RepID=UPI0039EF87D9